MDALLLRLVIKSTAQRGMLMCGFEAFHWFATEESLTEIHRVLRPGAAFGVSSLMASLFTLLLSIFTL